mmetsp:Transcript_17535/g.48849  ORF Transcript_17535/g.48849 Transcript_17535/m.48849 type:complete len:231 (+) Transcript_17535:2300-2992(+)
MTHVLSMRLVLVARATAPLASSLLGHSHHTSPLLQRMHSTLLTVLTAWAQSTHSHQQVHLLHTAHLPPRSYSPPTTPRSNPCPQQACPPCTARSHLGSPLPATQMSNPQLLSAMPPLHALWQEQVMACAHGSSAQSTPQAVVPRSRAPHSLCPGASIASIWRGSSSSSSNSNSSCQELTSASSLVQQGKLQPPSLLPTQTPQCLTVPLLTAPSSRLGVGSGRHTRLGMLL